MYASIKKAIIVLASGLWPFQMKLSVLLRFWLNTNHNLDKTDGCATVLLNTNNDLLTNVGAIIGAVGCNIHNHKK